MYANVPQPFAETYQNNNWNTNGQQRLGNSGPRRSAPNELPYVVQHRGRWRQGGQVAYNAKPRMYLVRPTDGKRLGASGRLLDGILGEGPDVFVSKCGDKRTLMRDRPQRWQWSGWGLSPAERFDIRMYDKDFRRKDLRAVSNMPSNEATRSRHDRYNFVSRKYENRNRLPRRAAWVSTDMRWEEGAKRNDSLPLCYRDGLWQWHSRVPPSAGNYPGGRPRR